MRRGRGVQLQESPTAGEIHGDADPLAWHDVGPLDRGTIRRARRLDVHVGGEEIDVDAFFRDSYGEYDSRETVLHEYGLRVLIDRTSFVIREAKAEPHVLPYNECSDAAA